MVGMILFAVRMKKNNKLISSPSGTGNDGWWPKSPLARASGTSEYNFIFVVCVCFTLECDCSEIITVSVSCLAVNMIRSCIDIAASYLQTVLQTQRNILMVWRILEPCLLEVSHGIMYKLLRGAATVPLVRGTVDCSGEVEDHRQSCT